MIYYKKKIIKAILVVLSNTVAMLTYAQSPGGVSTNLQLWLKANDGWSSTNWLDKSPNGFTAAKTGTPTQTSFINFNPTITMDGDNNYYSIPHHANLNQSAANKITVIAVATSDKSGYLSIVSKYVNSSWDSGWGMTLGNSTYRMGFHTGDWTGSEDSQAAYQGFTENVPNIFTGYSTASTGKNNYMAVNGATATPSVDNINTGTNTGKVYLSYNFDDPFNGNIAEVIMYNDDVSGEREKIETYLAIKYGIHKIGNYVDSDGNVVWDATANAAYHNNVAGVKRDNTSALDQKESKSINPGSQVLITTSYFGTTGTFAENNSDVSPNLHNQEFVIWGDNGQPKSFTTPLVYNAPGGDVNFRFGAIWKLQITGGQQNVTVAWPSGSTNFHLIRSTDDTFDTTDEFIPMSGTATVNGVIYNTATFLAQDGDYFTFAGKAFYPAGVAGNVAWFKADKGVSNTTNGAAVSSWANQGTLGSNANQRGTNPVPTYKSILYNFNPSLSTNDSNARQGLRSTDIFPNYNTDNDFTLYLLGSRPAFSGWNTWVDLSRPDYDTNNPWFGTYNSDDYLYWDTGNENYSPFTEDWTPNVPFITGASFDCGPTDVVNYFRNGQTALMSNAGDSNSNVDNTLNIFNDSDYDTDSYADIPEVILYDRVLTSAENEKIESYLAIKYGLTLRQNSSTSIATSNYVSSTGTQIWSITGHTFNNNVFGIALDFGLDQKVSHSINNITAASIIAATTEDFVSSNLDTNRTSLSQGQYQMFGDNGNTTTATNLLDVNDCPALNGDEKRIPKAWRSQNTADTGAVWIQVSGMSIYDINNNVFLLVGDTVDGSGKITGNTYTVPGTITGDKAVFYAVLPGVKYFTVGGTVSPGTCSSCVGKSQNLYHWKGWDTSAKRLANDSGDFTIGTDANGPITARTIVNYVNPSMEISPSSYPNNQGSGTWIGRRDILNGNDGLVTYTTTMSKAAIPTFILEGVSKYRNNTEVAVVKGYCGTELVTPILTPYYNDPSYQSYTISGNTITGKNWQGYNGRSDVNVTFPRKVDKVVIEWVINRTNTSTYNEWLYIYNYKLTCEAPIEPNKDNVNITEYFSDDTQPACKDNTLNIKIENKNCNVRTLDFSNILPVGLEYVADSYDGVGNETVTAIGTNLSISNLVVPSGTSIISIKVKPTDSNMATATFETQGTYSVTVSSGGTGENILTDSASGEEGLQKTLLEVTAATPEPMPNISVIAIGDQTACGNIITYTVTLDNTSINQNISNLIFKTLLDKGQDLVVTSVVLSSGLSGTIPPYSEYQAGLIIEDLSINSVSNSHTIIFQTVATEINLIPINAVSIQKDPAVSECSISSLKTVKVEKCPTCEGGKGYFDMNYAWWIEGLAARTANEITNDAIGSPTSGHLFVDAKVNYPTDVEWLPNSFPRWYGNWTEFSRYDNKNGAAGLVSYEVKLKDADGNPIAAKPSFQVSGMGNISGQTDIVAVKGYCGTTEVLPKLLYAYNSTEANNTYWRRFSIDNATATATGVKPYYDTYSIGTMNVEFEKDVDRVVVEWSVNRTPIRKTLGYLYVSDMKFACKNAQEPNADEVYITASTKEESRPTCDETTIKLLIQNLNCDAKEITLNNTLPSGIEYVADSYVGLGTETPTYAGQNFSLSSLSVPSGNSYVYVNVKSTNNTPATYNTLFNYTVIGGTNSPNPYRSDDDSGVSGFQDLAIYYTASTNIQKPIVTNVVDKCFKTTPDGNGTELTYTVTIQNPNATAISNVEFNDTFETNQTMVPGSVTYVGFTVEGINESDVTFINLSGMEIAGNTTATITFKVMTNDTTSDIINMIKVNVDPSTECGSANSVYSNELLVKYCIYCVENPNTTVATEFTNVGISTQATKQAGWPENIPNGFIVLESKNKGFVITRTTSSLILDPKKGMLIYDTVDHCLKIYNGTIWKCIERCTE